MTEKEQEIRLKLGIPLEASRVLILSESSHWDPDWMHTFEEYYQKYISRILDKAIAELEKEPRRIYSVECIFFLKMYWERNPSHRNTIRNLVNERRLRLTGSGFTTPDTTLPDTESIIRDYLYGQEWLRDNGMVQEPKLAYLPDNFGNSPALPSILRSLGFDYTAISRIDGMFFPGSDWAITMAPLPGSSADLLVNTLKTCDFIWRYADGSEILCHWNPFTYGQGDMLETFGAGRFLDIRFGFPARSASHTAKRIRSYADRLSPLSKTPYMLCPIGFDFNSPIQDIVDLLDRYNKKRYPDTGIYAVNAGIDDYLDLVSCYRHLLPAIDLDSNPYWMGFYASKPELKQRCIALTYKLLTAEKLLSARDDYKDLHEKLKPKFQEAWEVSVVSNHHDFITGTTPARVWKEEQIPLLMKGHDIADSLMREAAQHVNTHQQNKPSVLPKYSREDGMLRIETAFYRIVIDEKRGGCITSWTNPATGDEMITGPSNDIILFKDTGGLWRLGHEFRGGAFREIIKASDHPASVNIMERNDALHVEVESFLEGKKIIRRMFFRIDTPIVQMRTEGSARDRRTITCRFMTSIRAGTVTMDVPGGIVERPVAKLYDPTFWSFKSFAIIKDPASNIGLALSIGPPATIHSDGMGSVEWIAVRNARKERAFGFLPVPAHPASGPDPSQQTLDYGVWFTGDGPRAVSAKCDTLAWLNPISEYGNDHTNIALTGDINNVKILAVKPASRGDGIIIRLYTLFPSGNCITVSINGREIQSASLCDARERDVKLLPVTDGRASVPITCDIITVRVII